jgi:hypothetical protein
MHLFLFVLGVIRFLAISVATSADQLRWKNKGKNKKAKTIMKNQGGTEFSNMTLVHSSVISLGMYNVHSNVSPT